MPLRPLGQSSVCSMQNIKSRAFGSEASQARRALHHQPPVSWEGVTEQGQGEPRGPPKMMAGGLGWTHSKRDRGGKVLRCPSGEPRLSRGSA